jgi:iron(III) transport system substrate-binding protein
LHIFTARIVAVFIVFLYVGAGFSATVEESLDQLNRRPAAERQTILEREARKEGRVVFYTTFNVADLQDVKRLFEQKYPYLKIEEFRLGHARLANKIRTEALAGKLEADIITMSATYLDELRGSGAVTRARPPVRQQLHDGFTDKEGWLNGLYNTAYLLHYNTKLVKPEELPKDWNDLLNAKWQGQLAIDQESYEWFSGLLDVMGEERGLRFAKQLAGRDIAVRRGHTLLSQLLAAGEFKIVLEQYDHIAYRSLKAGTPTNYVFLNPIIAEAPNAVWIGKNAARPHGAALLMDFLMAKDTQNYYAQRGRHMAHNAVAYLPNPPANFRWLTPNREKWGPRSNELIKMFRDTFMSR